MALDPFWGYVTFGLHLSGSDGTTTFPDVKGHTFARTGSVVISTAQSRFAGEGAAYFPGGASDRLLSSTHYDYAFRDASLSLSVALYPLSLPPAGKVCRVIMIGDNNVNRTFVLAIDEAGKIGGYVPVSGYNALWSAAGAVTLNAWQDFEFSHFKGGQAYLFKDGVLIASMIGFTPPEVPFGGLYNAIRIGGDQSGNAALDHPYAGYLSELQFMARGARHCGNFTPASAPFPEGLELFARRDEAPRPLLSGAARPAATVIALPAAGRAAIDVEHGGHGQIVGTTKNTGSPDYPVSRRVRLLRQRDGVLVRQTWSDDAGNYRFEHLREDVAYVVMSHDHTGVYNAVIADTVLPEPVP